MRLHLLCLVLAASQVASVYGSGFKVSGTQILDANRRPFVMKGVNIPHTWYKNDLYKSIPFAAKLGINTVRVVLSDGAKYQKDDKKAVATLISLCAKYNLALMLEVHDTTGKNDLGSLNQAANYWIEMKDVLRGQEHRVIINIANEWLVTNDFNSWARGYASVIPKLRQAGLNHLLMVDATGYGQVEASISQRGKQILMADPQRNVAFGLHLYGVGARTGLAVRRSFDHPLSAGLAIVITEFSERHNGGPVAFKYILAYCQRRRVGWLAWSLYGNSDHSLDLAKGPSGPLTTYGMDIFRGSAPRRPNYRKAVAPANRRKVFRKVVAPANRRKVFRKVVAPGANRKTVVRKAYRKPVNQRVVAKKVYHNQVHNKQVNRKVYHRQVPRKVYRKTNKKVIRKRMVDEEGSKISIELYCGHGNFC